MNNTSIIIHLCVLFEVRNGKVEIYIFMHLDVLLYAQIVYLCILWMFLHDCLFLFPSTVLGYQDRPTYNLQYGHTLYKCNK